jgi:hypothetical protein
MEDCSITVELTSNSPDFDENQNSDVFFDHQNYKSHPALYLSVHNKTQPDHKEERILIHTSILWGV